MAVNMAVDAEQILQERNSKKEEYDSRKGYYGHEYGCGCLIIFSRRDSKKEKCGSRNGLYGLEYGYGC